MCSRKLLVTSAAVPRRSSPHRCACESPASPGRGTTRPSGSVAPCGSASRSLPPAGRAHRSEKTRSSSPAPRSRTPPAGEGRHCSCSCRPAPVFHVRSRDLVASGLRDPLGGCEPGDHKTCAGGRIFRCRGRCSLRCGYSVSPRARPSATVAVPTRLRACSSRLSPVVVPRFTSTSVKAASAEACPISAATIASALRLGSPRSATVAASDGHVRRRLADLERHQCSALERVRDLVVPGGGLPPAPTLCRAAPRRRLHMPSRSSRPAA